MYSTDIVLSVAAEPLLGAPYKFSWCWWWWRTGTRFIYTTLFIIRQR